MPRRIFPGPLNVIGDIEVGIGSDRKTVIDEDGNVTGDIIFSIVTETAAELVAAYPMETGTWRLFFTSDNELALLTPAGIKLVTLTDPE